MKRVHTRLRREILVLLYQYHLPDFATLTWFCFSDLIGEAYGWITTRGDVKLSHFTYSCPKVPNMKVSIRPYNYGYMIEYRLPRMGEYDYRSAFIEVQDWQVLDYDLPYENL